MNTATQQHTISKAIYYSKSEVHLIGSAGRTIVSMYAMGDAFENWNVALEVMGILYASTVYPHPVPNEFDLIEIFGVPQLQKQ